MNRRKFLGLMGLSGTAYFFAPRGGWLSHQPVPQWSNVEYWKKVLHLSAMERIGALNVARELEKEIVAYNSQPGLVLKEVWEEDKKPVRALVKTHTYTYRYEYMDEPPPGYVLQAGVWVPGRDLGYQASI